jgi:hypothetical protein
METDSLRGFCETVCVYACVRACVRACVKKERKREHARTHKACVRACVSVFFFSPTHAVFVCARKPGQRSSSFENASLFRQQAPRCPCEFVLATDRAAAVYLRANAQIFEERAYEQG